MNIETKLRALFIPNPPDELGPSDESQYRDGYNTALEDAIDALSAIDAAPKPHNVEQERAAFIDSFGDTPDGAPKVWSGFQAGYRAGIDAAGALTESRLLEIMGEHDFTIPAVAFDAIISDAAGESEGDVRVDLMKIAEIHADAAYLFHRVHQGTLLPDDAAAAVRDKIDAAIAKGVRQ